VSAAAVAELEILRPSGPGEYGGGGGVDERVPNESY
jgi:hypothetical protein